VIFFARSFINHLSRAIYALLGVTRDFERSSFLYFFLDGTQNDRDGNGLALWARRFDGFRGTDQTRRAAIGHDLHAGNDAGIALGSDAVFLWFNAVDTFGEGAAPDLKAERPEVGGMRFTNPTGVPDKDAALLAAEFGVINSDTGARLGGVSAYANGAGGVVAVSLTDTLFWSAGAGSPEGAVLANKGSIYSNTTDGKLYRKSTDGVNTGWVVMKDGP